MSQDLTALLPTLITQQSIALLRSRSGFVNRARVETTQENKLNGGSSVTITKQVGAFTPTNVSYSSAASAQDVIIPDVTLSFSYHKEVKIKANELESRISQGNLQRVLRETIPGMVEGIITTVDASVGALYVDAADSVGSAGQSLDDATVREAVGLLADAKVDIQAGGVNLVVSSAGYFTDLMSIDRYVLANQSGTQQALRGGVIPSQYNIGVDYSQNITVVAGSPDAKHGLMFERDAVTIGFIEFESANKYASNAQVEESIMTDPLSGVSLRTQRYYDPELRTWFYQIDCKWGVVTTDANRMIDVIH